MPLISVIIPVYNRPEELERALRSVLNQSLGDLEILVVDDFSETDIKKSIDKFNDNRIRYFRLEKKGNANVCRNLGIKNAQGSYIAMLDSDDEWLPDHLEKKLGYLKLKNADGVFGSCFVNDGETSRIVISRPREEKERMVNYILSGGAVTTPTHFYKTECARSTLWDETLLRHQDYDFCIRFAETFKFLPSEDLTCIVHWKKGERRSENFPSVMAFIKKYEKDIQPGLYNSYHQKVFYAISERQDIDDKIKQHYQSNSVKYIQFISLADYLGVMGKSRSKFYRLYLRFQFAASVLFK